MPSTLLYGNTAEVSSKEAELKSYKAEVRAKTIAVGKAEVTLNEVGDKVLCAISPFPFFSSCIPAGVFRKSSFIKRARSFPRKKSDPRSIIVEELSLCGDSRRFFFVPLKTEEARTK